MRRDESVGERLREWGGRAGLLELGEFARCLCPLSLCSSGSLAAGLSEEPEVCRLEPGSGSEPTQSPRGAEMSSLPSGAARLWGPRSPSAAGHPGLRAPALSLWGVGGASP